MVLAALAIMILPVRDEPVNEITSTSGCVDKTVPTSVPCSFTELTMPAGSEDASWKQAMMAALVSGVCGAGFITTAHPAASAGATERTRSVIGAFHGTITETTPDGSRVIRLSLPSPLSKVRPKTLRATPA